MKEESLSFLQHLEARLWMWLEGRATRGLRTAREPGVFRRPQTLRRVRCATAPSWIFFGAVVIVALVAILSGRSSYGRLAGAKRLVYLSERAAEGSLILKPQQSCSGAPSFRPWRRAYARRRKRFSADALALRQGRHPRWLDLFPIVFPWPRLGHGFVRGEV